MHQPDDSPDNVASVECDASDTEDSSYAGESYTEDEVADLLAGQRSCIADFLRSMARAIDSVSEDEESFASDMLNHAAEGVELQVDTDEDMEERMKHTLRSILQPSDEKPS
jgi:hypothetical protein